MKFLFFLFNAFPFLMANISPEINFRSKVLCNFKFLNKILNRLNGRYHSTSLAFLCSSNFDSDTLLMGVTAAQKLTCHYKWKDSDYQEIR